TRPSPGLRGVGRAPVGPTAPRRASPADPPTTPAQARQFEDRSWRGRYPRIRMVPMGLTAPRRPADLAVLLLLLGWVAFLAFGGLDRAEYVRLGEDLRAGRLQWPADAIRVLRAYPSDDGDIRRAWAYARATLGRSYSSFYVRTAAEWQAAFARGELRNPQGRAGVNPRPPPPPRGDLLAGAP